MGSSEFDSSFSGECELSMRWGLSVLKPSTLRKPLRQLIQGGLLSLVSERLSICEEGFCTGWKQGDTPNENPKNLATGGVFIAF